MQDANIHGRLCHLITSVTSYHMWNNHWNNILLTEPKKERPPPPIFSMLNPFTKSCMLGIAVAVFWLLCLCSPLVEIMLTRQYSWPVYLHLLSPHRWSAPISFYMDLYVTLSDKLRSEFENTDVFLSFFSVSAALFEHDRFLRIFKWFWLTTSSWYSRLMSSYFTFK